MPNKIILHRRLLAAAIGALVALPSSVLIAAFFIADGIRGTDLLRAGVAPVTGTLIGLLLGAGVKPLPAAFPGVRVVVAALLALPIGSLLTSVVLVGPWWMSRPLEAVVETVLYSVTGVIVYGWIVVLLTTPSAIVGAFFMQWLLGRFGATGGPPTADLRGAAA